MVWYEYVVRLPCFCTDQLFWRKPLTNHRSELTSCLSSLLGCYVHYPTISTDMLDQVKTKRRMYNNRGFIAGSPLASFIKLRYYKIFAWLYSHCGRVADAVMVNSSWTEEHIRQLWSRGEEDVVKVYPPCDTSHLEHVTRDESTSSNQVD